MAERQTEQRHASARGLDLLPSRQVLALLARGQADAAACVSEAIEPIAQAADIMAGGLRGGGRVVYAAAGSSGLMALADALELPGTFGIAREKIIVLLAGGMDALTDMRGGPEDDGEAAADAVAALDLGEKDCLLALTASGGTAYPIVAARKARTAGARTIGIANNAGAALFDIVDVAICLPTPPEVLAGSTRMGAGTAQKIALNMLSTMMAIKLGHVHDGLMVNLLADNEKLRIRARGIVSEVAGVDDQVAAAAIATAGGAVKPAILVAAGANLAQAEELLTANDGVVRPALAALRGLRI